MEKDIYINKINNKQFNLNDERKREMERGRERFLMHTRYDYNLGCLSKYFSFDFRHRKIFDQLVIAKINQYVVSGSGKKRGKSVSPVPIVIDASGPTFGERGHLSDTFCFSTPIRDYLEPTITDFQRLDRNNCTKFLGNSEKEPIWWLEGPFYYTN